MTITFSCGLLRVWYLPDGKVDKWANQNQKKRRSLFKLYKKVTSSILVKKKTNKQKTGTTSDLHHSFEKRFRWIIQSYN